MPSTQRFRYVPITLGLALLVASCATFAAPDYYHYDGGPIINESNVAVLVNPGGNNFVVLAQGRNELHTHLEDGSHTGFTYPLAFNIRAMTPGPNRELWALSTTNRVYRIQLGMSGNVTGVSSSFGVVVGEDIAVSADGANVYIATNSLIVRYNRSGTLQGSVAFPRSHATALPGSAQRVAVDTDNGFVYSLEPLNADRGSYIQPVFRRTRFSPDLTTPQSTDVPINDGAMTLHDFEISGHYPVWERSSGSNPTTINFVEGSTIHASTAGEHATNMRAGSLSSAGIQAGFAPCGGEQGAYLWRSRTNWPFTMLERRAVCED